MTRPPVHQQLWRLLKEALKGWLQDNVPRMGASIAYYTLFALAPVLILVIALGGSAVLKRSAARS